MLLLEVRRAALRTCGTTTPGATSTGSIVTTLMAMSPLMAWTMTQKRMS